MPSRFVLVADASASTLQRVSKALSSAGYFAMSARSMAEALAAVRAGDLALVIGSMRLPDGSGYELAGGVRRAREGLPVLLLGDGLEPFDPLLGAAAGVGGSVEWPCSAERLRAAVDQVLRPRGGDASDPPSLPAALLEPVSEGPGGSAAPGGGAADLDDGPSMPSLPVDGSHLDAPELPAPALPAPIPPGPAVEALEEPPALAPEALEPADAWIQPLADSLAEPTGEGTLPVLEGAEAAPGSAPRREPPMREPPVRQPAPREAAPAREPVERPRLSPPEPQPAVGDERVATFLPRDWKTYPPVRVDPAVVAPAVERAILELLPEVLDTVLRRALQTSPALRDLVEASVDEAVRAQLAPIARGVILERLAEIEAQAEGE